MGPWTSPPVSGVTDARLPACCFSKSTGAFKSMDSLLVTPDKSGMLMTGREGAATSLRLQNTMATAGSSWGEVLRVGLDQGSSCEDVMAARTARTHISDGNRRVRIHVWQSAVGSPQVRLVCFRCGTSAFADSMDHAHVYIDILRCCVH